VKVLDAAAAAALIPEGATVAVSGGGYRAEAESVFKAIAERFGKERQPAGITLLAISMLERARGGVGGAGTGLNRLAIEGLTTTLISGSFARAPDREINHLIRSNAAAAYNLPMGTVVQLLRTIAAGRNGLVTPVGIGTFVDPRIEGGRANSAAKNPLSKIIDVAGEEMLFYPRFDIDVGLIKASAADERGNLYMDREAFDHGLIDVAMATRTCRGTLIAEVNRIIRRGDLPARMVRVPGGMVDVVVVASEPPFEDEQAPLLLGEEIIELPPPSDEMRIRDLISTLAVEQLPQDAFVNLGAGIPMYDVPEAARRTGRDDLYFTVEQGPMGGWPQVGGVSRNPEAIMGQLEVFDFYEGGGPDISVLSFGEIDATGSVNVSRFGTMMPGCGGFPNIGHGLRHLVLCGTLTAGGLKQRMSNGRLEIVQEGRIKRFVKKVEQVTFNAPLALARGHKLTVITERGIFNVGKDGYRLEAVAPGVDIDREIREQAEFPIAVSGELRVLPEAMFTSGGGD
jgi:acyl CoA:acetate/3-ketoacid CoA transferase